MAEPRARDGGGGAPPEPAVLDDRHERNARAFYRREDDEQGMVAVALGDLLLVVLFSLLHADHLRGAGLAAAGVFGVAKSARAGALLVDPGHRALHEFHVLGLEWQVLQQFGLEVAPLAGAK